jgi:hypothetical protein
LVPGSLPSFAQEKPRKADTKQDHDSKVPQKLERSKGSIEYVLSQSPKPVPIGASGTFKFLGSKFAVGKLVKGAPYSATAVTESTQTLSDGNQIIRKNEATIYRDSEGRTRIEQRLETIGKWSSNGEAPLMILINDPVAGVSYSLDPRTSTVHKNVYGPQKVKPGFSIERNSNGTQTFMINGQVVTQAEYEAAMASVVDKKKIRPTPLPGDRFRLNGKEVTQSEFEAAQEKKLRADLGEPRKKATNDPDVKEKPDRKEPGRPDANQRKTESLGTQVIEGVNAEGTRTTLTIPAGEIGNIQPIEIVDETWYSTELQLQVMTKHQDPRTGAVLYRLTNLNRSEPDRSLFEIPAGYTVNERTLSQPKPVKRPPE